MISPSSLLVQAVGQSLATHLELNRRVVGRRIFEFSSCNVCLATRVVKANEVNVIMVKNADLKSVGQIAGYLWKKQLTFHRNDSPYLRDRERLRKLPSWVFRWLTSARRWMESWIPLPVLGRMDRLCESGVLVNDFSHSRFPKMRGYKPSRQPDESKPLSITLGRPEQRVVWESGRAVPRMFAPICVRVDHRICDSFQLSQFVATLIKRLERPNEMQDVAFHRSTESARNAA